LGLISIHGFDPSEDQFILEKIKEATITLDEVVRDINTIVSARKSDENIASVYLPDKLRKVEALLEVEMKESLAVITTDFSQVDTVHAIPGYMLSIVYNLVSNAIKYRKKDVTPIIHLACSQNNQFHCLSISDNGLGIDLVKNKDKIFGLYKRFHGNEIEGRGIGLNLVKTHAESQGGYVDVQSTVNEGTTFKIYIPKLHKHGSA
jgi:light-regulated signal transduction histidine kinase (bacteriophytochrome)